MDPTYQARAFYGGPDRTQLSEPQGSARHSRLGSRSITAKPPKRSRFSAYPDRYHNYQPVAEDDPGGADPPCDPPVEVETRCRAGDLADRVPTTGGHLGAHQPVRMAHPSDHRGTTPSTPARISPQRTAPRSSPPPTESCSRGVLRRLWRAYRHRAPIDGNSRRDLLRAYVGARHPRHRRVDSVSAGQHIADVGRAGCPPDLICISRSTPAGRGEYPFPRDAWLNRARR